MKNPKQLNEGLNRHDLKGYVSEYFSIDKYKSKMGEDADVVTLSFKVREKYPAIDLMEFIEKGYNFILDADMSAGEEMDGQYQVFVEMERTPDLPEQMDTLIKDLGHLCAVDNWKFRYQKSTGAVPFSSDKILEHVPVTSQEYHNKILEIKNKNVSKFFNQGALEEVKLEEDNTLIFKKPFFGPLKMKLVNIGYYDDMKKQVPGALSLDENGQSQVYFLQKYLGNYEIDKIGDKFLIKNGNKAIIAEKDMW